MNQQKYTGWQFFNGDGTFKLQNPDQTSYLYFPLANEAGMMSSITPTLHGDLKTGLNAFALAPVSAEDLHNTKSARNFWVYAEGKGAWSAAGNSAKQMTDRFAEDRTEEVILEAGFLWHKVSRSNKAMGMKAEIQSFVPTEQDTIELMKVTITNIGEEVLTITPTAAIPIYGRSADNFRDHRHVTSLLHRIQKTPDGVIVKPSLSFDERGHKINQVSYGVLGAEANGVRPIGVFPILEDFIGEGGSLEWPQAVVSNLEPLYEENTELEGFETIGGLRFQTVTLNPNESKTYVVAIAVDETGSNMEEMVQKYCTEEAFDQYLQKNQAFWEKKLNLHLHSGDADFDQWMKWVTLQPILRRIYGCSFLPHHDYGRGGRGWRDLWQDCLALLIMEPEEVRFLLLNNYAGVRMDGTNATIIGVKPGEFIADRNNITRVWMDHGAWPFLTTKLYIDQSGDIEFLLEKQTYFKDIQVHRGKKKDMKWAQTEGSHLKSEQGSVYTGTILEHILVQHLTSFFNVGEHNHMKLDGADWNDALDMAWERGESIAFTALYGSNMKDLAVLIRELGKKTGIKTLGLAKEILLLIDSLKNPVEYDNKEQKHQRLEQYYQTCAHTISGETVEVEIEQLAQDLEKKSEWIADHIRKTEWIQSEAGYQWFNGYYDNAGERVEGDHPLGLRMTLTGQVFPIMGNIATEEQVEKVIAAADQYLYDQKVGGYRLNTNFHELKTTLGRCFGFAFGHKENGAMFSHMAVMYGNALYKRGYAKEGYKVLESIYAHCRDFEKSRIYPGIPEYIHEKGRGMYHYLTGSASWMLLTVLTQMYGVRGALGDLLLEPKLMREQFDESGNATVQTTFANRTLHIRYENKAQLSPEEYKVVSVYMDGKEVSFLPNARGAMIPRGDIENLEDGQIHQVVVVLGE